LGTETDGSIMSPSSASGLVGIKPTVGLTNRQGVIPISHTQDSVGPHARTVADAAAVLSVIAESGIDYCESLDGDALEGARIGVAREFHTGYSQHADPVFEQVLDVLRGSGAELVDALVAPTKGPTWPIDLLDGDRILGGSAQVAAVGGFPLITVPAGFVFNLLPIGLTFIGPSMSEPTLIKLAYAFEQASRIRRRPRYAPTTLDLP
jgi:Asp-tRNA(Asn)/Glu-tRNA(Gln) amidotransferase A subunit family amidase